MMKKIECFDIFNNAGIFDEEHHELFGYFWPDALCCYEDFKKVYST